MTWPRNRRDLLPLILSGWGMKRLNKRRGMKALGRAIALLVCTHNPVLALRLCHSKYVTAAWFVGFQGKGRAQGQERRDAHRDAGAGAGNSAAALSAGSAGSAAERAVAGP